MSSQRKVWLKNKYLNVNKHLMHTMKRRLSLPCSDAYWEDMKKRYPSKITGAKKNILERAIN